MACGIHNSACSGAARREARRPEGTQIGRHHADDFRRHAINGHRAADDVRILLEAAAPQRVADDHDRRRVGAIFFGKEQAADLRLHAQRRQQSGGDARGADALGLGATHRDVTPLKAAHRRKRPRSPLPFVQVGRRRKHDRQGMVGGVSQITASDLDPHTDRANSTRSVTAKMAVVVPMPSARVTTATAANPGRRSIRRRP